MTYLDIAIPAKPADWSQERARIEAALSQPDRMAVLGAMAKTSPAAAGAQLAGVRCAALIVEGSAERELEQALVERIIETLGELGSGFSFVGRQVPFDVDGDEFFSTCCSSTSNSCATWSSS